MAKVVVENLVKTYQEKNGASIRAVNGINLVVEDSEFMVLVGPSGCGKSTTLRMIAGLEEISDGVVIIDGRVVNDLPPKDRDIAMVFQNYALYPHMSVYDNMAFGLKLKKFSKVEIDRRVREAAAILGLEQYFERKPKSLSGGQRQRVAVGRAIVRKPKVFLFDEPLSNLDAKMRTAMRVELTQLHQRLGATFIYVTHDQVEAMTMGDRICVMRDGDVMQVDAPRNLYANPRNLFVAGFIGSPPMNFFNGMIRSDESNLAFVESDGVSDGLRLPLNPALAQRAARYLDRPIVLGIRSEHVETNAVATARRQICTIDATVDMFEPIGAEAYLHIHTRHTSLIVRVPPSGQFDAGQNLGIGFHQDQIHLFDPLSEEALK